MHRMGKGMEEGFLPGYRRTLLPRRTGAGGFYGRDRQRTGGQRRGERRHSCSAGDFIFIEPGVPHEVFNLSETEPVVAVVARSSAAEWDNIIPYDRKAT